MQMVSPANGEYVMEGTGGGYLRYSVYDEDYTDFTYEVEVCRISGMAYANNAIMFRSDGTDDNCYQFGLNQGTGRYTLVKYVGGTEYWISPGWTDSPATNLGLGAWNRLKVVCSGSNITLYINDVLVGAYTDTEFSN